MIQESSPAQKIYLLAYQIQEHVQLQDFVHLVAYCGCSNTPPVFFSIYTQLRTNALRGGSRHQTTSYGTITWRTISNYKDEFVQGVEVVLDRGDKISFWQDAWVGEVSSKDFALCDRKEDRVAEFGRQINDCCIGNFILHRTALSIVEMDEFVPILVCWPPYHWKR